MTGERAQTTQPTQPTLPPLPLGFALEPDRSTRVSRDGRIVFGGTPWRLLRLSDRGAEVADRLLGGDVITTDAEGRLARRLVEGGLAHPTPPPSASDLCVVVPVRDRASSLDRCLTALHPLPIVVVDDGSLDADAVARVAAAHAARLVRRPTAGGPAAARNAGLVAADADAVAFVDSDCIADAESLRSLTAHLADPAVGAVAPRVRPRAEDEHSTLTRYLAARSPLDVGTRAATVRPGGRVSYVPTAALVVRRAAADAVGGFDEGLRHGEDVDLCWRLHDGGWSVRYDPRIVVAHDEPTSWGASLSRRFRYGTSAGPLATRHPQRLCGPALTGLTAPVAIARQRDTIPTDVAMQVAATAPLATAVGLLRWATPLWGPLLVAATRGRRRTALATALVATVLVEWLDRKPRLDPIPYAAASLADDASYGAGVWVGSIRARTAEPLLPRLSGSPRTSDP